MKWRKNKFTNTNMKCPWCGSDQMGYTNDGSGDVETVKCYVCFRKTDSYEAMKQGKLYYIDIEHPKFIEFQRKFMNQYDKRKQLSLLTKEVENIDRDRQDLLVQKEMKAKEIAKLQTELRLEEFSKSVIKTTAANAQFEQIEITGVPGRKYRVQLREPETGVVIASFFHKL